MRGNYNKMSIKNASEPVVGRPMRGYDGARPQHKDDLIKYYNKDGECSETQAYLKVINDDIHALVHTDGIFYNNLYDPYETTLWENTPSLKWIKIDGDILDLYTKYIGSRKRGFYNQANLLFERKL